MHNLSVCARVHVRRHTTSILKIGYGYPYSWSCVYVHWDKHHILIHQLHILLYKLMYVAGLKIS